MHKENLYFTFYQQRHLCDAVLRVGDTEFHVHKIILYACSPYFRNLFTQWSSPDCRIFDITDVSPETMSLIVEFFYTGCAPVTDVNAAELFITADRYDIPGLMQVCSDFLEKELKIENCISIWLLADSYYYPKLRQKAFSYILTRFERVVVASKQFPLLSVQHLIEILQSNQLLVETESNVYEAVRKWISHSPDERREYMSLLLPHVRLALISPMFICKNVAKIPFVCSSQECRLIILETLDAFLQNATKFFLKNTVWCPLAPPRIPPALIYAIGGWSNGNPVSTIEAYDPRTEHWVNLSCTEDVPRAYHGTVVLNGYIYCVGGYNRVTQLSSVSKFNLRTKTWQEASPMHVKRCFVSVTVLDGIIYALGGYDGLRRLRSAERYDPGRNQWTFISSMHDRRSDASCVSFERKVYICGGFTGIHCLSTVECYNPRNNQWTWMPSMSSRRSGIGVAVCERRIYAIGGFNGTNRLRTAEFYNSVTKSWETVSPMLCPRSNFGITVDNHCLYVVGGYNGNRTTQEVEFFNAVTNRWIDARDMVVSRSALSCCLVEELNDIMDYIIPVVPGTGQLDGVF
ncbi:kelch-like protein 10 [Oryzias melastigma]|uniref:kelch-like protein 10 n=1 Tax=Oryzias melastigma TaxID=30732 RepID=UPI000CF7E5AA|nr:kelch-like protein 10 [Oryzias melastigma]